VAFVVSVCTLASRHIDDPRVRANPSDGVSSGTLWFDLFSRLRTLPEGDRPSLYTIQATLVAGIYAIGWGKLSKAFALISESVTLSLDARTRTIFLMQLRRRCVSAHFGALIRGTSWRGSILAGHHMCGYVTVMFLKSSLTFINVHFTRDYTGPQPTETPSRMGAFICAHHASSVLRPCC